MCVFGFQFANTCTVQAAALGFYIVCGFLSLGFITDFVVIITCLMLDFWIVSPPPPLHHYLP